MYSVPSNNWARMAIPRSFVRIYRMWRDVMQLTCLTLTNVAILTMSSFRIEVLKVLSCFTSSSFPKHITISSRNLPLGRRGFTRAVSLPATRLHQLLICESPRSRKLDEQLELYLASGSCAVTQVSPLNPELDYKSCCCGLNFKFGKAVFISITKTSKLS